MADADFAATVAAAQAGDEQAFVVLFRSVQPLLLRYLRTVAGSAAEDVASDAWVGVVRNLHTFSGDEQGWRAWVFTIARSRLRDEQRRLGRRPVPVDTETLLAVRPDGADVHGQVEEIATTEAALALIARLPKEQAEMVLLRHVVGLDVAHTARVVGKTPGAVRVAVHRGLRRLEALLGGPAGLDQPGAGNAVELSSDR
ncbi:MAG: RNA polymerase sigma factor [Nocardioidaceae bacterium]